MKSPLRVFEREMHKKYSRFFTVRYYKPSDSYFFYYKGYAVGYWLKGDKKEADKVFDIACKMVFAIEARGINESV